MEGGGGQPGDAELASQAAAPLIFQKRIDETFVNRCWAFLSAAASLADALVGSLTGGRVSASFDKRLLQL